MAKTIPLKNSGLIGADIAIGATQATLNPLPSVTSGYITLDSGNASKTEEVSFSHSGSNPVTISAATKEHTNGAQWLIDNTNGYYQEVVTGSGFDLNNNVIPAKALATSAIKLGYAQITSPFTTTSTSATLVTGLSATVTIPAGSRSVKITVYTPNLYNSASGHETDLTLWDGTVGSGTLIQKAKIIGGASAFVASSASMVAVVTPSAGSKTYNVGLNTDNASYAAGMDAGATYPSFILVECI